MCISLWIIWNVSMAGLLWSRFVLLNEGAFYLGAIYGVSGGPGAKKSVAASVSMKWVICLPVVREGNLNNRPFWLGVI